MTFYIKATWVALWLFVSGQSAAVVINSSTSIQADLQGLDWLSLDVTENMSRNEVDASSLISSGAWRYATRSETEILINSLWAGIYNGYSADNAAGALDFLSTWGVLYTPINGYTNPKISNFFFGQTGECSDTSVFTCVGAVKHFDNAPHSWSTLNVQTGQFENAYVAGSGEVGYFTDNEGGNFGVTSDNLAWFNDIKNSSTGSLLVREAVSIPAPKTLSLLCIGLLFISSAKRKKITLFYRKSESPWRLKPNDLLSRTPVRAGGNPRC